MKNISDQEPTTRRLLRRAQEGDRAARSALLKAHLGLVIHFAKRFYRPGAFMEMEDLAQQGCLGLLTAIGKFDLNRRSRGKIVRFATYARYWIEHAIRREIENRGRTIALPVNIQRKIRGYERLRNGIAPGSPGAENLQALAQKLGLPRARLESLCRAALGVIPLENLSEEDEVVPMATAAAAPDSDDPERVFDRRHDSDRLRKVVAKLPKRERYVMERHYGLRAGYAPQSLGVMARSLGISRERVRQVKLRAVKRMQELTHAEGDCRPDKRQKPR